MARFLRLGAVWLSAVAVTVYGMPGAALAQAMPFVPQVRFDLPTYDPVGCASVEIRGYDRDNAGFESVELFVLAKSDRERLTLQETTPNSGEFALDECVSIDNGIPDSNDGVLQVSEGELVAAALYGDGEGVGDVPLALDVAGIRGGDARGSWRARFDPDILSPKLQSTPGPAGEPDFPLAKVDSPVGSAALFGEDQVLVRVGTEDDLDDFLERRGGTLLSTVALPIPKKFHKEGLATEAEWHLVRVDPSTFDASDTRYWMEKAGIEGTYTYSSRAAFKLIALVLEEQLGGLFIAPSGLLRPQAAPVSNEGVWSSFLGQPWFDNSAASRRVGGGQGLTLLSAMDQKEDGPQVPTAIIDGGFASEADYPTGWGPSGVNRDHGKPFVDASRCSYDVLASADCSPNAAGGTNPLPCTGGNPCPWHGTQMFGVAGAELDNGYGGAGVGAHVVDPMFYKIGYPYVLPLAHAVNQAVTDGARVINISSGMPCAPVVVDICSPGGAIAALPVLGLVCASLVIILQVVGAVGCGALFEALGNLVFHVGALENALVRAERSGVVVAAGAGNSQDNVNAVRIIPCMLGDVVCVGSLDRTVTPSSFSGFGRGVDIWAPGGLAGAGTGVPTTPDPATMQTPSPQLTFTGGTSASTAWVSGTVALIRSIAPDLNAAQTRNVLFGSRCGDGNRARLVGGLCTPSTGPAQFSGYVDVVDTIHRARSRAGDRSLGGCTGGWDGEQEVGDTIETARVLDGVAAATPPQRIVVDDLSIHAFPSDDDWLRFRPPNLGTDSTEMRVRVEVLDPDMGSLELEVNRARSIPGGLVIDTRPLREVVVIHGNFPRERDWALHVRAPSDVARNDNCYRVSIEVIGPGPRDDRYEPNNRDQDATSLAGWSHTHHDNRARQSDEAWRILEGGLSLTGAHDRDVFSVRLPNPTNAAEGGHGDLRECDVDTFGGTVWRGLFTAVVHSPHRAPDEHLRIENLASGDPLNGFSPGLTTTFDCPRGAGHRAYRLLLGHATNWRHFAYGYELRLDYKIQVTNDVPQWMRELEALERGALEAWGCPSGFMPGCGGRVASAHPIDASRIPGCLADGCPEYMLMNVEGSGVLDLVFTSAMDLQFELFDASEQLVAQALPPEVGVAADDKIVKRMHVDDLDKGLYALRVSGPAAGYQVEVNRIPTGQRYASLSKSRTRGTVFLRGEIDSGNPGCRTGEVVKLQVRREGRFVTLDSSQSDKEGQYFFKPDVREKVFRVLVPAAGICHRAMSFPLRTFG